ncbi:MAG: hypothetical protein ACI9ES_000925, partial [Oceanospirillaceae bacterium]
VSCAATMSALAWIALKSKDRVGGLVIGDNNHIELRPKASRKVVLSYIRYLNEYCHQLNSPIASSLKQNMDQLLLKLKQVAKPGSAIYIASDFHDIDSINLGRLVKLSQHSQITFIMISDPLEWTLPFDKHLLVTDGSAVSPLNKSNHPNSLMQTRVDNVAAICKPLNIELIQLSTRDNLLDVLQQRFSVHSGQLKKRRSL